MNYESVEQAVAALKKHQATMAAYNHALGVLYLDATTAAPSDTWEGRGRTMEIMSEITYKLSTDPENEELLSYLEANLGELDEQTKREVEVLRKGFDQTKKIPAEEYIAYSVLQNDAQAVWAKAKNEDDFASFAPCLEKIVDFNRKFAGYYDPDKNFDMSSAGKAPVVKWWSSYIGWQWTSVGRLDGYSGNFLNSNLSRCFKLLFAPLYAFPRGEGGSAKRSRMRNGVH